MSTLLCDLAYELDTHQSHFPISGKSRIIPGKWSAFFSFFLLEAFCYLPFKLYPVASRFPLATCIYRLSGDISTSRIPASASSLCSACLPRVAFAFDQGTPQATCKQITHPTCYPLPTHKSPDLSTSHQISCRQHLNYPLWTTRRVSMSASLFPAANNEWPCFRWEHCTWV